MTGLAWSCIAWIFGALLITFGDWVDSKARSADERAGWLLSLPGFMLLVCGAAATLFIVLVKLSRLL